MISRSLDDSSRGARRIVTSDTPISSQEHFRKRIATQIESAGTFHRAEEYHQQNLEKRGRASCVIPASATEASSTAREA